MTDLPHAIRLIAQDSDGILEIMELGMAKANEAGFPDMTKLTAYQRRWLRFMVRDFARRFDGCEISVSHVMPDGSIKEF